MTFEDLKPGDILLCPPTPFPEGWIGQAIILLTGGKVSHTAMYCGEKGGEPRIAHSDLRGIYSMPLKDFLDESPGCYLMRLKDQADLLPVLHAIDSYADKGNPYPVMNFGVLGLLIIGNRLAKDTLRNRAFYDFTMLVGLKIIQEINKHKYKGKHAMTCSQFASQCFTDAGALYDIQFDKLILGFGGVNSIDDRASLLDYIMYDNSNGLPLPDEEDTHAVPANEDQIISNFMGLMRNDSNDITAPEYVEEHELSKAALKLLIALCEAITGVKPSSPGEALDLISSNRNYFVTPDDLLMNAANLEELGYFDKSILA